MKKTIVSITFFTFLFFSPLFAIPLVTTTIGSYPKPSYIHLPDWFHTTDFTQPSKSYEQYIHQTTDTVDALDRATREVVQQQEQLGIDIPTDGEVRRENYIYYYCRHLNGIDFNTLSQKKARNGAWNVFAPTITSTITAPENNFLVRDYQVAQAATKNRIKMTIPGPMTIADSVTDTYYYNEEKLGADLAHTINRAVKALAAAGCNYIQIDEPLFARKPHQAITYGIKHLERCFADIPDHVIKIVHICCGYPLYLDQEQYERADPNSYHLLASALDTSCVNAISIEDAHRRNDLSLLTLFKHKTIILGVIDVSCSRIETVQEIEQHIRQALMYIDPERLMIAPDCGLGFFTPAMIEKKVTNMVQARNNIKKHLTK